MPDTSDQQNSSSSSNGESSAGVLSFLWSSKQEKKESDNLSTDPSENSSSITSVKWKGQIIPENNLSTNNQDSSSFDTSNAGVINEKVRQWTIQKRRERDGQPMTVNVNNNNRLEDDEFLTAGLGPALLDEYTSHCGLRWYERLYDECSYRFHEAIFPMRSWRWRHFIGLYVLQRFFMRPVLYAPGILAFYHLQIGRRLTPLLEKRLSEKSLFKLMGPAFWDSGFTQGWMRLPFQSQRYREACADFTVFLSFTWPVWYWARVYYGYYIIEFIRWRIDLDPTLSMKRWKIDTVAMEPDTSQTLSTLTQ